MGGHFSETFIYHPPLIPYMRVTDGFDKFVKGFSKYKSSNYNPYAIATLKQRLEQEEQEKPELVPELEMASTYRA